MSFQGCEAEIRGRFAESLNFLNHLRLIAPPMLTPVDDLQKSMRALFLVSVYAAFERGVNAVVEAALDSVSEHDARSIDYIPSMQAIVHFAKVKSLHQGSSRKLIDASKALFEASMSLNPVQIIENPLADKLQNVDAGTLIWVAKLFGINELPCNTANVGRLGTLRERRNAVAHGRESASRVGERYTLDELANVYDAADSEIARFLLNMREQCSLQRYVRRVA